MTPDEYKKFLTDFLKSRTAEFDKVDKEAYVLGPNVKKIQEQPKEHETHLAGIAIGIGDQIQIMRNLGLTGKKFSDFNDAENVKSLVKMATTYRAGPVAALDKTIKETLSSIEKMFTPLNGIFKAVKKEIDAFADKDKASKEKSTAALAGLKNLSTELRKLNQTLTDWRTAVVLVGDRGSKMAEYFDLKVKEEFDKTSANREAELQRGLLEQALNPRVLKPKVKAAAGHEDTLETLWSDLSLNMAAEDPAKRPTAADILAEKKKGKEAMLALVEVHKSVSDVVKQLSGNALNDFKGTESERLTKTVKTHHDNGVAMFKALMALGT